MSHFLEVIDDSILRNIFWNSTSKMKCFFKKTNSLHVKKSTKHHMKSLLFESILICENLRFQYSKFQQNQSPIKLSIWRMRRSKKVGHTQHEMSHFFRTVCRHERVKKEACWTVRNLFKVTFFQTLTRRTMLFCTFFH